MMSSLLMFEGPEHLQPMISCVAMMINTKFWQIGYPVIRISQDICLILIKKGSFVTALLLLRCAHILLDF